MSASLILQVEKLRPEPGDFVVVKYDEDAMPTREVQKLASILNKEEQFKGIQFLFMGHKTSVSKLSKSELLNLRDTVDRALAEGE